LVLPNSEPCWFGVPILCAEQGQKELLVSHFEEHKIQTRNYFGGNILFHPAYKHLDDYIKFPNGNKTLDLVFFLGCSPAYTQPVLDYIDEVVQKW
jgi:CDP-6-deoxy-D-xylo-4-hexulose-3-dehydrase